MSTNRRPGPTQLMRVLALLRTRALDGGSLNTTELLAPTVDRLPPIVRLPSRINELRDAGFRIETQRASNGTAAYFLRAEPALPPPAPTEPTQLEDQGRLFSTTHLLPYDQLVPLPRREAA